MKTLLTLFALFAGFAASAAPLRLLYWNFQNGMWEGQGDDYAKFVDWVKSYDPDVCVWCEGETLYKTGTSELIAEADKKYLPAHLAELAARYGHSHVAVAAHRDSYPQLITSKYPIEIIRKIAGTPYTRDVIHGAGWFRVAAPGRDVNFVTVHPWPHRFDPNVPRADREKDIAQGGGDRYRRIEMEEILAATVAGTRAAVGDWVMLGDFNSVSRADAALYDYPADSTSYLLHDLVASATDYVDILAKTRPNPEDRATVAGRRRIDFVYVSPSIAAETKDASVVRDAFTKQTPVEGIPGFLHPSDHLPILVDFDLKPMPSIDPCLEYASAELAAYAMKLTGKPLPEGFVTLSVDPKLGEQAFRIRAVGGAEGGLRSCAAASSQGDGASACQRGCAGAQPSRLVITGGDAAGVLYGVYEYLERHCGVRWYAKFCEKVPRIAALPLPKGLDDTQKPAFRMRTADWYDVSHDPDFAARLRLNGELLKVLPRHGGARYRFGKGLGSCHTMNDLVDPLKYFHTHPEYFAEWEGKRDWDEHCFTNPDVFRITLAGVLERMRKDPTARWYGVSQNDTDKHCRCAKCAAVNAEEGSPAGTLVRFVNAIAAEVEKEFPAAVIETLAYRYSSKPPKKTRLRKNVMPCFCTFECEFANPMTTSPLAANRAIAGDIAGWKAMMEPGSDVYVWDYTTCFPNYLMPFPNVRTIRENCRFFRDCGVTCVYEQGGCQGRHAEFAELKAWLTAKWLWNPDAPYEELVDDFMNGYYGKAAPFVRRYFDKAQALAKTFDPLKNPLRINIDPRVSVDPRAMGLTDAFLDEGEAIFQEALAAVKDDPASWWRVRLTALTIDYCRARREGPNRPKYIRELRRAMEYVKAMDDGVIRLSNGGGALKDKKIQKEFDEILKASDAIGNDDGLPPADAKTVEIRVYPDRDVGPIKRMNGSQRQPNMVGLNETFVEWNNEGEFADLHVPMVRTYGAREQTPPPGRLNDPALIFPDFDADENDPKNYDFELTDVYLDSIRRQGGEILYTLGSGWDGVVNYGTDAPPKDFAKWARICEHIIRHYNEGWGRWGSHVAFSNQFNVVYWEIWNEPDLGVGAAYWEKGVRTWEDRHRYWSGSPEQFFELYATAAKYLKGKFPQIRIGGPGLAGRMDWAERFLGFCQTNAVPIDFFTWHRYAVEPQHFAERAREVRQLLDKYGYARTESHLNEWNGQNRWTREGLREEVRQRSSENNFRYAALYASVMGRMQHEPVDVLMYHAMNRDMFNGVFSPADGRPLKGYYAFRAWSRLARLGREAKVTQTGPGADVTSVAAKGADGSLALLIARYHSDLNAFGSVNVRVAVQGRSLAGARLHVTDEDDRYTERELHVAPDGSATLRLRPNAFAVLEL